MVTVKRIKAGQYSVSDGRYIIRDGSSWYVLNSEQEHDLGPLPTLSAAKQYVTDGKTPLGEHNMASSHGRRQSKKEFNAYLASEVKNGNSGPAILYFLAMAAICVFFLVFRGY
ncbi:hypothetical protein HWV00_06270 [Moritella sp. 24]|uniref:hypothetical protein n=1 Tax=Moritella sp. 24 TaxID=2746230 RepID=UPI001BA9F069|nr:hypothetical protein [Moritella sp. 24]QUM75862.1 hypothetical protein HWV00_06270 [Moritella sp. 24]